MKTIGDIISAPLKAIGLVQKAPKLPAALPQPTVDDARAQIQSDDALRRRRGGAADILTGTSGAEAAPTSGGKDTLGS